MFLMASIVVEGVEQLGVELVAVAVGFVICKWMMVAHCYHNSAVCVLHHNSFVA